MAGTFVRLCPPGQPVPPRREHHTAQSTLQPAAGRRPSAIRSSSNMLSETIPKRSSRPMAVNMSVMFWLVGQGLSLFGAAGEADWHDGVMYPVFIFMVALFLLVAWQVRQGRNWARWTLVVFVAFRFLGVHRLLRHFSDIPAYQIFLDVLLLALLAGAVWLLFLVLPTF